MNVCWVRKVSQTDRNKDRQRVKGFLSSYRPRFLCFSASLGSDTEQTDLRYSILRDAACASMCRCSVRRMCELKFLPAHLYKYADTVSCALVRRERGDSVSVRDSAELWEPATPGGSDWKFISQRKRQKQCRITVKGRCFLDISRRAVHRLCTFLKREKVTSHPFLEVLKLVRVFNELTSQKLECSTVSLSCRQPFGGHICNSLQSVPVSFWLNFFDLCLCWISVQAGPKWWSTTHCYVIANSCGLKQSIHGLTRMCRLTNVFDTDLLLQRSSGVIEQPVAL